MVNWQPYNEYSEVFPKYTANFDKLYEHKQWQQQLLKSKTIVQKTLQTNVSPEKRAQSIGGVYGTVKNNYEQILPNIDYYPIVNRNPRLIRDIEPVIIQRPEKLCIKVNPIRPIFGRYEK